MRKRENLTMVLLLIAVFALQALAQNQVDLTFNAAPSLAANNTANTKGQAVQADGKVIVWGGSLSEGSKIKGLVARLNTDGSVDTSFTFCGCGFGAVATVAIEASGEMLVAGSTSANRSKVVRIFDSGALDTNYATPFDGGLNSPGISASIRALQPDGKALIATLPSPSSGSSMTMGRYQTNGLADPSFTPIVLGGVFVYVPDIAIASDGKFYLGFTSSFSGHFFASLKRFNADGTVDESWTQPAIPSDSGRINGVNVQADGSILVSGLNSINGVSVHKLARILSAGNVDLAFNVSGFVGIDQVESLANGKILIAASVAVGNPDSIYRLNSNGSTDSSLVKPAAITAENDGVLVGDKNSMTGKDGVLVGDKNSVRGSEFAQAASTAVLDRFSVDAQGKVVFFGSDVSGQQFYRLDASGSFDSTFDSRLTEFGKVSFMLRQADGKVVINGTFIGVNGVPQTQFARLDSDGSLDPTFNAGTGFDLTPTSMISQADGRILAAGMFTHYNGTPVSNVVRINSDGSLDAGFTPHVLFAVNTLALQGDGKIMVGGGGIARLNVNGTVDNSFSAIFGSPGIVAILVQSDGKFVVGGSFAGVNGFSRNNLARLNSDGSLDTAYNPTGFVGGFSALFMQPDGKVLAGNNGGSDSSLTLSRLNVDGTTDATFSPVHFGGGQVGTRINAMAFRANGEILVGGDFNIAAQSLTRSFAWLNSSGKVSPLIFPEGVDGIVRSLVFQPDGKLLMAGDFSRIGNTPRPGVARVSLATFHGSPQFDFDGDGRADISIFRPSDGNWYLARSSSGFAVNHWGQAGDKVAAADFDGDDITDLAVYRGGDWWYLRSGTGAMGLASFGTAGDIPVPADFDGDGKADFIYFRPATGEWFRKGSTAGVSNIQFGLPGDQPLIADFDGDGKADPAVFRPSTGVIWYAGSVDGLFYAHPWGQPGDIPVLGDYDGDGKTDPAVFRPSESMWYIMNSHDASITKTQWGFGDDKPVPADYDGDGKTDLAIYRPSNGMWFIEQSTSGPTSLQFGLATDKPVPGAFVP
jgi:uncharacterized delta-60 repeat protein